jgi:transcriptional regulator with XRE-family HTH domain
MRAMKGGQDISLAARARQHRDSLSLSENLESFARRSIDNYPKGMTQRQIATGLGISVSAVSRLAQNGMPCESVEAAAQWRLSRAKQRRKSHAIPLVATKPDDYAKAATNAERTAATESLCYNVMLDAARTGDVRIIGRASRDYLQALKMAEEAKQAAVQAALASKNLVPSSLVLRAFDETLGVLLDRLRRGEKAPTWSMSEARTMVEEAVTRYGDLLRDNSPEAAAERTLKKVGAAIMAAPAPDIFNPSK